MARLVQRLKLTRFEADEYYKHGLEDYRKRNLDQAILNLNEAIEALPNEAEYYAARGFFYLEDGVDDKARADFEAALKHFAYEMLAHYGLGVVAYRDSRYDEAITHFTTAHRCDTTRPEPLYYLALAYYHKRHNVYALQVMRQAHDLFADGDARKKDAAKWIRFLEKTPSEKQPRLPESSG